MSASRKEIGQNKALFHDRTGRYNNPLNFSKTVCSRREMQFTLIREVANFTIVLAHDLQDALSKMKVSAAIESLQKLEVDKNMPYLFVDHSITNTT